MFRLVRLFILLAIAFSAGFLYSEQRCAAKEGEVRLDVCFDTSQ